MEVEISRTFASPVLVSRLLWVPEVEEKFIHFRALAMEFARSHREGGRQTDGDGEREK